MTIPRKLQTIITKEHGKYHRIAKALNVNVYWVHRYIKQGQEPSNPEIRARMFLPKLRRKHDGRSGFTELTPHVQWWRKLTKTQRDSWIRSNHAEATKYQRTP